MYLSECTWIIIFHVTEGEEVFTTSCVDVKYFVVSILVDIINICLELKPLLKVKVIPNIGMCVCVVCPFVILLFTFG